MDNSAKEPTTKHPKEKKSGEAKEENNKSKKDGHEITQMVDHLVKDAIKLGKGKSEEQLDKIMKGVISKQANGISDNDKLKL